ncbi:MAG: sigma-54-dependent Fis family transcriptional regulator [Desulfobacterales bacterium]|nr:sigma-54-dependent Fis family transcriptional regulator [Desulfobacterales bacterium]
MLPKILVVDDEQNMLKLFQKVLAKKGYDVRCAGNGTEALRILREDAFDLIISDLVMPVLGGIDLMKEVKIKHPDVPFIVITAYGTIGSAVEAMKAGAFDYLTKPFHKDDILLVVGKALKYCKLHHEVKRLREELKVKEGFKEIIGKSKAMEGVFKLIGKVADSQATVLIQGESGTGKELIARAIHDLSSRRDEAFVAVDCSVLPEHLLQSELFGHVKGAFTGAVKDKEGLFLAADGGTLFLDEIGTISSAVQLNLLRVLQEKEIKPVGSVASTKVYVRVLAATNVDLEESMRDGTFRKDLYYRLAVVTVNIPTLRERRDDIAPLAHHFMRKYAKIYSKNISDMTAGAMRAIMENPWLGNVRELENVMERAVLLSAGPLIDEASLSLPADWEDPARTKKHFNPLKIATRDLARQEEREAIVTALKHSGGNKTKAAKLLGISRSSLYNKIRDLGIRNLPHLFSYPEK